jgi:hypothetical protein
LTPHNLASIAHLKSRFRVRAPSVSKSAAKNMSENEEQAKKEALLKVHQPSFL